MRSKYYYEFESNFSNFRKIEFKSNKLIFLSGLFFYEVTIKKKILNLYKIKKKCKI